MEMRPENAEFELHQFLFFFVAALDWKAVDVKSIFSRRPVSQSTSANEHLTYQIQRRKHYDKLCHKFIEPPSPPPFSVYSGPKASV